MTVGFVMLAHTALHRAAEVARAIAAEGCPVVIHVDRRTARAEFRALEAMLEGVVGVSFAKRFRCDWGTWSLVEASRAAAEKLLSDRADVRHVMLISGACLPVKPIRELKSFLAARPATDFIESVTIEDVPWAAGGLSEERFTMSFPFAWKRRRWLFDVWVNLHRRTRYRRRMPEGLEPHLGSQWWCLSRPTLERILADERREELDRYFRRVWIPDESYFQSLVRLYGAKVESRSLTLSRFDFQGKPHVFFDDHLSLLTDTPAFFARKVWPNAHRLYDVFLSAAEPPRRFPRAAPGGFADRVFGEAVDRRTGGRAGLTMAGRYPRGGFENGLTTSNYAVFHGFGEVFRGFTAWLSDQTGTRAHGHLFAADRCHFDGGGKVGPGCLSDSAALRDYDSEAFLRNLIWNTRGEHQSFLTSAHDNMQIGAFLARDRNARIFAITGAWILPLLYSGRSPNDVRAEAARLQAEEAAFLALLRERRALATSHVWSLADVLERPSEPLQQILDELTGADARPLAGMPDFSHLTGLPDLLQALRNAGMNPYLAGEVSRLPSRSNACDASNVIQLR